MGRTVKKVNLKDYDQSFEDMQYWLSKSPQERIAAVTFLIHQNLSPGERMDRSHIVRLKMKK